MRTGIVLTTPGKNRFWHSCANAVDGLREMEEGHAADNRYGKAWDDPATVIEFGTDDGKAFTATERIRPKPEVKDEDEEDSPEATPLAD